MMAVYYEFVEMFWNSRSKMIATSSIRRIQFTIKSNKRTNGQSSLVKFMLRSLILLCHFPTTNLPSILRAVYDTLSQLQIDAFCGEVPSAEKLHPL